jgi:hypothetical protein
MGCLCRTFREEPLARSVSYQAAPLTRQNERCHENASDCLRLDRCGGDAGDTSTCRLLRGLPSRRTMPGVLRSVPAILWSIALLCSAPAILWSAAAAAAILWSAILMTAIERPQGHAHNCAFVHLLNFLSPAPRPERGSFFGRAARHAAGNN